MAVTQRPKILIVDHNEQVAASLRRLLRQDYDVTVTPSGEQGLEHLSQTEFAAVVVSDTLPWLGGVEFLQRALTLQPHTCRVLMGVKPKSCRAIQAINHARVHAYVSRPWVGTGFVDMLTEQIHLAQQERCQAREHQQYRRLLLDDATGLPCRAVLMETVAARLAQQGFLAVLQVDCTGLWAQQQRLTQRDFTAARTRVLGSLRSLPSQQLRRDDHLCVEEVGSARFSIFLAAPRDERLGAPQDAHILAGRLRRRLRQELDELHIPGLGHHPPEVYASFTLHDPRVDPRFAVQQLLGNLASRPSPPPPAQEADGPLLILRRILEERCIRTLFQPIVSLSTRQILGYEALSRGPVGSGLESPERLLTLAEQAGLSFELDRLLRSMAMTHAVQLPSDRKIFINTLASTAHDPDLATNRLSRFLQQLDIAPSRVVFEFSERCNIGNHDGLLETLQNYRSLGVGLAIDDVGAGYSGLERIVALHPDYLKIDRSLVQDLHKLPVKRSVLQALMSLSETLGAEVIAEGIEQGADARALADLGIPYGQGHLLGKPAHPQPAGWSLGWSQGTSSAR